MRFSAYTGSTVHYGSYGKVLEVFQRFDMPVAILQLGYASSNAQSSVGSV